MAYGTNYGILWHPMALWLPLPAMELMTPKATCPATAWQAWHAMFFEDLACARAMFYVTFCVSDCSCCAAMLILRWLAQSSGHLGRVRSFLLCSGALFDGQGDFDKDVFYVRELAHRSFTGSSFRDVCRELLHRPCTDKTLLQRSCQNSSYRELVWRSLVEYSQETS